MSNISFNNMLSKAASQIMGSAAETLAERIKLKWQDLIQKRFYDLYEPVEYERTYQLLNSVVSSRVMKKSNNKFQFKVTLDPDGTYYESLLGKAEGHQFESNHVWWLASFGQHGWVEPPTEGKFFDELLEWLESGEAAIELQQELAQHGIIATVEYKSTKVKRHELKYPIRKNTYRYHNR